MSVTDLIIASGLTREQICDATGLKRSMLSMIERGKRRPTAEVACKLARVLNAHPSNFRPDLADLWRDDEAESAA